MKLIRFGVLGMVAIGAVIGYFSTNATRDDTGQITEAGEIAAEDLRLGDCFDEPAGSEFSELRAVPCNEPHDGQVVSEFTFAQSGSAYPGVVALDTAAVNDCSTALAEADLKPEAYQLQWYYFGPTEESWDRGDRRVSCVLAASGTDKLTSSVINAS